MSRDPVSGLEMDIELPPDADRTFHPSPRPRFLPLARRPAAPVQLTGGRVPFGRRMGRAWRELVRFLLSPKGPL